MTKVRKLYYPKAKKIKQFDGHEGSIYTLEQGAEPHLFFSGSNDNLIVEWDLTNPKSSRAVAKLPMKAFAIKYIPQRNLLLVGNFNGGVHVIDLAQKKEVKLIQFHQMVIFDIQYWEEKDCFFVLSGDGSFSVWSLEDFSLIKAKRVSEKRLRSMDFQLERREFALGCGDGTVRIFDLDSFEEKQSCEGHQADFSVTVLRYTPDGKYLISGSRDAHLNLWDVEKDYAMVKRIPAHNYAIYSISFSPDGSSFATGSMDKSVKVWETNELELLLNISKPKHEDAHANSVNSVLWSTFENALISTGDDRTIKAWEVK